MSDRLSACGGAILLHSVVMDNLLVEVTMSAAPDEGTPRESGETLHVAAPAPEAQNINVEGRKTQSPREGFGQLWRKTYRLALTGADVTPERVVATWKEHFSDVQPPENRVYPPLFGMKEGQVVLIEAQTPGAPPISTGVQVMEATPSSFKLATPQGHPEAGWVEFRAERGDDGVVVAQVQSVARASDPLYEVAFRVRGSKEQERIWHHVLRSLGGYFGTSGDVEFRRELLEPDVQWSKVFNLRHNAMIGTVLHNITSPLRRLFGSSGTR